MTEHVGALIAEARDYANRRTGTVPGDLVLRLVIELETAAAERDAAVRRAQAEALRDAAGEIEATFADYDRRRPLHPKAEVATDYVNDSQWAELIVRNRADRIEQEVEHD